MQPSAAGFELPQVRVCVDSPVSGSVWRCDSDRACVCDPLMSFCVRIMPKIIHSQLQQENTSRSVGTPTLFAALPNTIRADLLRNAIPRSFSDGQSIWHRGDIADGFWVIDKGQVKVGQHTDSGEMQALFILGPGDSLGDLALLGKFPRVADADALGALEMRWISETVLYSEIAKSSVISDAFIMTLAQQLQESFDRLIVFRNMPAPKRLAQNLLALAEGKEAPVKLGIRQHELAELVGVSRMTIASALAQLDSLGLVTRHYRHLIITDPEALRLWMQS